MADAPAASATGSKSPAGATETGPKAGGALRPVDLGFMIGFVLLSWFLGFMYYWAFNIKTVRQRGREGRVGAEDRAKFFNSGGADVKSETFGEVAQMSNDSVAMLAMEGVYEAAKEFLIRYGNYIFQECIIMKGSFFQL